MISCTLRYSHKWEIKKTWELEFVFYRGTCTFLSLARILLSIDFPLIIIIMITASCKFSLFNCLTLLVQEDTLPVDRHLYLSSLDYVTTWTSEQKQISKCRPWTLQRMAHMHTNQAAPIQIISVTAGTSGKIQCHPLAKSTKHQESFRINIAHACTCNALS